MSVPRLNIEKIRKAIQNSIPLSITTYTLPQEMELYMAEILMAFLKELKQEGMSEYLVYCLSELTTNAKKANTKRVYFKEKNLNIKNVADYEKGMETFKSDMLENIKHYLQLQEKAGYYIKLIFQSRFNKIKMEVRNNVDLTFFEYKRIHDKITRAGQFSSIEEAFLQSLDDTEGAGLGIIIMILMLKKIGLTGQNFQIFTENGETVARIILAFDSDTVKKISLLSSHLVDTIERLPRFPENIIHITNLLNDPEFKLKDIVRSISADVALTAEILKLVNSAAFSLTTSCSDIAGAVKLIGMNGVKNLLYSIGSMKNLGSSTPEQKELWNHSYKVAFYSYNLSRGYFSSQRDIVENSYVCGLLHDMGKSIFYTAHPEPEFMRKMKTFAEAKNIPTHAVETLISGQNHAEIGALIAKKWNFPNVITDVIQHHHEPDEKNPLSAVVYFANMLVDYEENSVEFYQFDSAVLRLFNINSEEQLKQTSNRLKATFVRE